MFASLIMRRAWGSSPNALRNAEIAAPGFLRAKLEAMLKMVGTVNGRAASRFYLIFRLDVDSDGRRHYVNALSCSQR